MALTAYEAGCGVAHGGAGAAANGHPTAPDTPVIAVQLSATPVFLEVALKLAGFPGLTLAVNRRSAAVPPVFALAQQA